MLPGALTPPETATSSAFGTQWRILGEPSNVFRAEFESYLAPLPLSDLRGRVVLDAGCGMGKFSMAAADAGARAVVAVDLSEAVDVAFDNLRDRPNVHVVQGNIERLPLRRAAFDFVFSIGVLHHMPEPARGFAALVPFVAVDGRLFAWVYAREGNEAFARWLDPFRARLFSRLPSAANRLVATLLAAPLWALIRALYVPLGRRRRGTRLPYRDYFLYFASLGYRTFWGTVYDKLVPPVCHYVSRAELEAWAVAGALDPLTLTHRNANSWGLLARKHRRE